VPAARQRSYVDIGPRFRSDPLSKHIQRYSRPKPPWKPVVMGYYRCERAPNELRSLMQPILAFCSSCGRDAVGSSHLRAGQLSEITRYALRARSPLNHSERRARTRGIRSISRVSLFLSVSRGPSLPSSPSRFRAARRDTHGRRDVRDLSIRIKETGISRGGRRWGEGEREPRSRFLEVSARSSRSIREYFRGNDE
jgi:hypothetical protein